MKTKYRYHQNGLTLIELLTTLTMVGILSSIALPAFDTLMQKNRQYSEVNNFLAALSSARSEAVKQGLRTVLCTSSDGSSCDSSVDWDAGWIVFVDEDVDNTPDSPDDYIRIGAALKSGYTIIGSTNINDLIRYDSNGDSLETGYFTICDPRGAADAQGLIITASGSPKKSDVDTSGNSLACP